MKHGYNDFGGRLENRGHLLFGAFGLLTSVFCCFLATLGMAGLAHGSEGGDFSQYIQAAGGRQKALAAAFGSDGSMVVVGYTQPTLADTEDYYIIKIARDPQTQSLVQAWAAPLTFDLAGGADQAVAVAIDSLANVVVTGTAFRGGSYGYDIQTIKYGGADGAILWKNTWNGPNSGDDGATAMALDEYNNIYIGGYTAGANGAEDFLVLKYNAGGPIGGKPTWYATYNGVHGSIDRVNAIGVSPGANPYVALTGISRNLTTSPANFDILTVKYNAVGTRIWAKVKDSGAGNDSGLKVRLNSGGDVFLAGYINNPGLHSDIYLAKYIGDAAAPVVDWEAIHDGGNGDEPRDLALDAAGDVYVTGFTFSMTGFENYFTAKYHGTDPGKGTLAWPAAGIYNSGLDNSDTGLGLAVTGDAVYVTGTVHQSATGQDDIVTIKYTRDTGNRIWTSTLAGDPGLDENPVGIGIAGDGSVLVAGWTAVTAFDYDFFGMRIDPGALNTPTELTATWLPLSSKVSLDWTLNSTTETGVEIFRRTATQEYPEAATYTLTTGPGIEGYDDTAVEPDTRYYYRIRVMDADHNYSLFSNEASVLTTEYDYVAPAWTYKFAGSGGADDIARAVAVGPDQHPVVTGSSYSLEGTFDYYTVKLNSDQTPPTAIWSARFDDEYLQIDEAFGVAVDGNNDAIVTGFSYLNNSESGQPLDLYTIKYHADTGLHLGLNPIWARQEDGPEHGNDWATSVAVARDAANGIVVVGYGRNYMDNDDIYVVKYLADGTRAWAVPGPALKVVEDPGGPDQPAAVALDSQGDIIVTGRTHNGSDYDIFTRKFRGTDGSTVWTAVKDGGHGDDEGVGLAVGSDDSVYVTGFITNASLKKDAYTVKYQAAAAAGEQEAWARTYDGPTHDHDWAAGINVDENGDGNGIVMAGTTTTGANSHDYFVIRYDSAGNVSWARVLDRPANNDLAVAMAMDVTGNVCLAGNTDSGNGDILTATYGYDGELLATTLYNGSNGGVDEARAMAAGRLGQVYVAGSTTNGAGNLDFLAFRCEGRVLQGPAPLRATAYYQHVDLTWTNNAPEAEGFRVQRQGGACATAHPDNWISLSPENSSFPLTQTGFSDTGLVTGDTYCYRIQAVKALDGSRWLEKTVTTVEPPAPGAFQAVARGTATVRLAWTDTLTGEDSFAIKRCQGSALDCDATAFEAIDTPLASLGAGSITYDDTTVCGNTTYTYQIQAIKNASWASRFAYATVSTPAATPPVLVSAVAKSEGRIDLTWSDTNTDYTGFNIYRCEGVDCTPAELIATIPAGGLFLGMDENAWTGAAGEILDSSGSGNHATAYNGAATIALGHSGRAGSFDGVDDFLSWTFNGGPATNTFSLAAWVKTSIAHETIPGFAGQNYLFYPYYVPVGSGTRGGVSVGTNGITVYGHGAGLPTNGLVMSLQMNESQWLSGQSGQVVDSSGAGNHATHVGNGANTVANGHYGTRAGSFNGLDSYLNLAYGGGTPTDNFTMAAWVKVASTHGIDTQTNLGSATADGKNFVFFPNTDNWPGSGAGVSVGTNGISVYEDIWGLAPVAVYNGELGTGWNHVVVTYTERRPRIYLNGILVHTGLLSGKSPVYAPVSMAGKIYTQYDMGEGFFAGQVDDVAIYNRALTDQEIQSAVSAPLAVYNGALDPGWNHVVVTFIDKQPRIYLNGQLKTVGTPALFDTVYVPNRLAGKSGGGYGFFAGAADDVAVYNRALTAQDITAYHLGVVPDVYSDTTVEARLVKPGTTYRYQVRAYKNASCPWETEAGAGGVLTATTGEVTGPDYTPELLTVTRDSTEVSGRINLTWLDKTETEENFVVERCTGADCDFSGEVTTFTLAANTTSYADTTACHDTVYRYRLRAERTTAPAWQSLGNILGAATNSIADPAGLAWDSANSNEQKIKIDWLANTTDESDFEIWRCEGTGADCDEDSEFAPIATVGRGVTSYSDTLVLPGTDYSYKVRAVNTSGCVWQTGFAGPLAVNTNLVGSFNLAANSVNTSRIDLTWTDITANESAFVLERCTGTCDSQGDFSARYGIGEGGTGYSDITEVCQGQTYSYRVKAIDQVFGGGYGGCWTRRRPLTITAGFRTDSVIEFTVTFTDGMQADFDDLRFYQFADGSQTDGQVLPHWIVKKTDGASALVWLKTGTGADFIYMYYGNAKATQPPRDSRLFEFYDDFAGATVDSGKWESYGTYDVLYQSDGLRLKGLNTSWRTFTSRTKFNRDRDWTLYYKATIKGHDLYLGFSKDVISTSETFLHGMLYDGYNFLEAIFENNWAPVIFNNPNLVISYVPYEVKVEALQAGGARYYIRGDNYGSWSAWHLFADTTAISPLTTAGPLRLKVLQLNGDGVINSMAVVKNSLATAGTTPGTVEDSACFVLPREWATGNSNLVPVTAKTAVPPTILAGATLSESELSLAWISTIPDETAVKVERCQGDAEACAAGPFTQVTALGSSLVLRLDMDEAAWNGTANEVRGVGGLNAGTAYNGATTLAGGHTGRAGSFDGANDYVRWSYAGGQPVDNFTMAAWVKATATHQIDSETSVATTGTAGQRYLFAPDLRSDGSGAGVSVGTNGISVYEHSGGYMPPLAVYSGSLGTGWNHIVVTYTNKQPRIYLNGVLVRTGLTSPRAVVYAPTWVGGHNPYGYFPGTIDEVAIYNRALGAAEVQNLYSRGTAFVDTALQANTWYTYRLASYKSAPAAHCPWDEGDIGHSGTLSLKTSSPPVPTSVTAAVVGSTDVLVTWTDNNASNTVYEVERSAWDGTAWSDFVKVGSASGTAISFTDRTACKGTQYKYRLRVVNEYYPAPVVLSGAGGSNWSRSRKLVIANWQANFQTKVVIPYDPDMRSDFADIRFWDDTARVELPYWIETKTDGVTATVWCKTGANNNIYLAYGNFNATSVSNGVSTFTLFDDFNDNSLDPKWTINNGTDGLPAAETGGMLRFGSATAKGHRAWTYFRSVATFTRNFVEEYKLRITSYEGDTPKLQDPNAYFVLQATGTGWTWNYWNPGATWRSLVYSPNIGANQGFVKVKLVRDDTSTSIYENEVYVTKNPNPMSGPSPVGIDLYHTILYMSLIVDVDDYRVRKYAAIEPSVSLAPEANGTTREWADAEPSPESNTVATPTLITHVFDQETGGVGWSRRQLLSIPANFQPNFQTRVVIPYDGDMQPDFDDLRFFDAAAGIELPYWIESKTDGVSATVWFKTGVYNKIHLYYGNALATGAGDGVATFTFFDDFNDNSLDTTKWWAGCNLDGCLPYAETEGVFRFGTGPATAATRFSYLTSLSKYNRPLVEEYKLRVVTDPGASFGALGGYGGTIAFMTLSRDTTGWQWWYWISGVGVTTLGYSPNIGLNNTVKVKRVWDDTSVKVFENDTYLYQDPNPLPPGTNAWMGFSFKVTDITKLVTMDIDDYRLRQYAAIEPAVTLLAKENAPFAVVDRPVLVATRYSEAQIDLAWTWTDPNADRTGFRIERCEGQATNCATFTVPATATSYRDQDRLNSRQYCYRISGFKTAAGSCGDGWDTGYSEQVCATTTLLDSGPIVPTAVDSTKINLTWSDNTDSEQGFRIWRCTANGTPGYCDDNNNYLDRNGLPQPVYQVGANRTTKDDANLCFKTTYYYKIQAKSEDGALGLANSGGGTWKRRARLGFTNFQAEFQTKVVIPYDSDMQPDFDDIRFFDEAAVMEIPYWIESKTDGVSATVWFKTLTTGDSVSLYYGNSSATSAGNSTSLFGSDFIAKAISGTMPTPTFQNSTGFTIEAGVTLWTDNDDTIIYFDVSGSNSSHINYTGDYTNNQKFVFGSSTGGNQYSAKIGIHPKASMQRWTVKVKDATYSMYYNGALLLSGNSLPYSSGAISFSGAASWKESFFDFCLVRKYAATEPTVTVLAEEVPPSSELKWGVTGNAPLSPAAGATTLDVAAPVLDENNTQQLNDTQIRIAWSDSNNDETGFIVERGDANCANFVALPSVGANVFATTDSSLITGQTYCYRVRPYKTLTNPLCPWPVDRYSDTKTVTIVPPAPTDLTAVNTETTVVRLEWNDTTTSETGFEIYRCAGAGEDCNEASEFGTAPVGTRGAHNTAGARVSHDDTTACAGQTYTYRVKAVQSPNWSSPFSNGATATTIAALPPTDLSQVEVLDSLVDQRRIDLTWTDGNRDETGFTIERCQVTESINCLDNGIFVPVGSHSYNLNETFDAQIDPLVWSQTAGLQSVSKITGPPVDIANISGSAKIFWRKGDGKAMLHTTSVNSGAADSYNSSRLYLKNVSWLGTKDFDLSIDFNIPNGLPVPAQYSVDARLGVDYANGDFILIERGAKYGYVISYKRGYNSATYSANTADRSGRLRIKKVGAWFGGYYWKDNDWVPLKDYTVNFPSAQPAVSGIGVTQYAQRNEIQNLITRLDNVSLVTIPAGGSSVSEPFITGIDSAVWGQTTSSNQGSAEVSWSSDHNDGGAVLKTTSKNLGEAGFNYTNLVATDPRLLGNGDFDLTFDYNLPDGAGTYAQHSIPLFFGITYPPQSGKTYKDSMYIERSSNPGGRYFAQGTIEDVTEYNSLATSDTSGRMRVNRTANRIKMYVWQNNDWTLVLDHGRSLANDTMPLWFYFGQYAKRNEEQALEAEIDNIKIDAARLRYSDRADLDPSARYVYRVRAVKANVSEDCPAWDSLLSNTVTEPLTNPAAPTGLVARAAGSQKMELLWTDQAADESEFRVERKLESGGYIEIAVLAANATGLVDTQNLDPDTEYTYRVRAFRTSDASFSAYSNEATGKTYIWGKLNSDDTTCQPEE